MRLSKRTLALAAGALLIAGGAGAQQLPEPVVKGETIGTPELVKAACAEGKVLFYSAQANAAERQIVDQFRKQFPCIQVSIVSAVTGQLYERIQTEAAVGDVKADLVLFTSIAYAQDLIDKGLAREWTPPAADKFPDGAKKQGYWYAGSSSLLYPVYNTNLVKPEDVPKTWADLLNPKWKGKLSTSTITSGGSAWILFAFMDMELGKDFLKRFVAQEPKIFSGYTQAVLGVMRGEMPISIGSGVDEWPYRVKEGAPIKPLFFPEGTPRVNYPMILFAKSPNPKAAELFANWYVSPGGQSALVDVRGTYSARSGIDPAPGNPPLGDVKTWNVDTKVMIDQYGEFMQRVTDIFEKR